MSLDPLADFTDLAERQQRTATGYWMRVGSAWKSTADNGREYISIQLEAIPLDFDGKLTMWLVEEGREEEK